MTIKREYLFILLLATLVLGHVSGRLSRSSVGEPPRSEPEASSPRAAGTAERLGQGRVLGAKAPSRPSGGPVASGGEALRQPPAAVAVTPVPPRQELASFPDEDTWRVRVHDDDPWAGREDSPATVVVFSAFGCQACELFKPSVDRLILEYGDRVKVVFQQKVFGAEHPGALLAAQASLAAHAQGKFWEYRDALFDLGYSLERENLETIADQVGLDLVRFGRELDDETHRGQVLRDSLNAHEVGANTFPNVIVNGVRMRSPKNWDSLKTVVVQELGRAEAIVAAGTPASEVYELRTRDARSFDVLPDAPQPVVAGRSPKTGPLNPKVEVVIYDDFECPICANAAPNIRAFQSRFAGDVRLVFKHFPLSDIHPDALMASKAAAEAHVQGRFWELHDILFASRDNLERDDLIAYAQELELDMPAFESAIDGSEHDFTISRDIAEGRRLGVSGTPTVFMNGQRYRGPKGLNALGLEATARVYFGFGG